MDAVQASFDGSDLENPMGERRKDAMRLNFDRKLKLEFHETLIASDAELLAYRELDEALGLKKMIDSDFCNNRTGKNTQHGFTTFLRQLIYTHLGPGKCAHNLPNDQDVCLSAVGLSILCLS